MISFKGMGQFSLIVAALTALLALAGCSGIPLIPNQPIPGVQPDRPMKTWDPTPEPSTESPAPSWTPEPTQTTESPEPSPSYSNGDNRTAYFKHFKVTMNGSTGDTEVFSIQPVVCVRKSTNSSGLTQISTAPWTITLEDGTVLKKKVKPEEGTAFNFPTIGKYRKGQCAQGWITFKTDGRPVREIGYANSLGNQALWSGDMTRIR